MQIANKGGSIIFSEAVVVVYDHDVVVVVVLK